ncbi:MAG: transcriptional regulator FeaR, partial [Leclercia adecarboxylata]|nr:transcriptional regulator FeaR [Leclercia adecarboxylata]
MRANEQDKYQRWLAQINQVCGSFAARPMTGEFYGELDATWTGNLKLNTVTAGGVNLFRTR